MRVAGMNQADVGQCIVVLILANIDRGARLKMQINVVLEFDRSGCVLAGRHSYNPATCPEARIDRGLDGFGSVVETLSRSAEIRHVEAAPRAPFRRCLGRRKSFAMASCAQSDSDKYDNGLVHGVLCPHTNDCTQKTQRRRVGRSYATATTAVWRSTTTPPNGRCGARRV